MRTILAVCSLALIFGGCAAQESWAERTARIDALYAAVVTGEDPDALTKYIFATTGAREPIPLNYNPQLGQISRSLQEIEIQMHAYRGY